MPQFRMYFERLASAAKSIRASIFTNWLRPMGSEQGFSSLVSSDEPPSAAAADSAYASDKPIASAHQDRFDRWPFAKRIAETLATRSDPASLVIALYGPWGNGKTSTLAMMEQALAPERLVVCVRFNPWHFQSHDLLLRAFFKTLADAVGQALPSRRERIGQLLDQYGALLSIASIGIAGGAVQITPGDAARQAGQAMSTVELGELKTRIEGILREAKTRVVVLIDDIDRLDRDETHAIFKLVKLSADFEYTSYVLAFDDEVVAASLGERYGAGGAEAGRRFLEKIVQVPLNLPSVERVLLRQFAFEGIDEALRMSGVTLTQQQADVFRRHFVDGVEPQMSTPRQAKLYSNALMFALPILKDEVNPVDQMLIESVRLFYPKLYAFIRENSPIIFRIHSYQADRAEMDRIKLSVDQVLNDLSDQDREKITSRLLVYLFPQLGSVFETTGHGPEWRAIWTRDQRVCSEDYFQRYFGYGVSSQDISDKDVQNLITEVVGIDPADAAARLQNFNSQALSRLVDKLRIRADRIETAALAKLSLYIAKYSHMLPRERGMLMEDMSFRQAAIFIAICVRRQEAGRRLKLATDAIEQTESLAFGFECLRWLRKGENEPDEDRILSETNENKVARRLLARVKKSAQDAPLYRTLGRDAGALLWLWSRYGRKGEVSRYLRSRIDANIAEVDEFLDIYVGWAWGMESGIPHRSDLDRSQYDAIARLVDPAYVVEKLYQRHGVALDDTEFHQDENVSLPVRFARQFTFVHRVATTEKTPDTNEQS